MSASELKPAASMKSSYFPLILLAAAVSSTVLADNGQKPQRADPPVAGASFYADQERGWFWYEEPPPEETEEEPEPKPEPQPVAPAETPSDEEVLPPTGSVAWLKIMLPRLREKAIDEPSETNIKAFFYAQRLMMDKAEIFSRATQETIKNEPLLDEDLRYPVSNAASGAIADAAAKQKQALLKVVAGQSALMLFYKGGDCGLCGQALASLTGLEAKYGFTIIPVSMDGLPLPGGNYPNTQFDSGLADHLGIITTPAIAMVVPPQDVRIVSYSTISMDTAETRILSAAKDVGLITQEEFNATSRMNPIGLISPSHIADAPADPTAEPEKFVNKMRDAATRAFEFKNGASQ
jgi:conjugal transfer pilus assembly protein TraF